ncbi:MAG: hypothetical protein K2P51_03900 [Rhabdochlamydiaceae bacterium]|nr:hypothetical protein [Rhabdochlamydiaceae bacterium]
MSLFKSVNLSKILSHPFSYLGLIVLCPLPLLIILLHFFTQLQSLDSLEDDILRLERKSLYAQDWLKKEAAFLSQLKTSDHFYIDKHLETLSFLEPEVKKMEALLLENDQDDNLKKRIQLLKGPSNKLLFSEEKIRSDDQFQEIEEKQQMPVEMNEEDLKKLLSFIEGITIWPYGPKEARPQLIVTDFQLTKKELPTHEHVFVVQLQLLKREKSPL